jgi:AraC-like DNA-binding protein
MKGTHTYRRVVSGVEQLPRADLPRHRHRGAYATVVLSGSFTEAAFYGRRLATPGDVLLHGRFDCHANFVDSAKGPRILRLPWHSDTVEGRFQVADPDRLVRLAERDAQEAAAALKDMLVAPSLAAAGRHWSDDLAAQLVGERSPCLAQWAEENGMSPETLSRGFRRAYGVSPKRFRLELRTRRAWQTVVGGIGRLTEIAHDNGFADLAHMSRSMAAFTGHPPSHWKVAGRRDQAG